MSLLVPETILKLRNDNEYLVSYVDNLAEVLCLENPEETVENLITDAIVLTCFAIHDSEELTEEEIEETTVHLIDRYNEGKQLLLK